LHLNSSVTHSTGGGVFCKRVPWLLLCAGSCLRLLWPLDMAWKFDEKWMFGKAQRVAQGLDSWPWVGMPSGVGLENPGFSIWPYALLAHVTHDPVGMVQAVQVLNVLALWGFALWVCSAWPQQDRDLGLWGVALFAVSPLPVLFARKIWAQDLLPVFVLPWLWAHSKRSQPWAAGVWGLLGALLGQLHMSGFFAAGALFVVTLAHDRKSFPWLPWLLGSMCGGLLLLPWLSFLLTDRARSAAGAGAMSLRFFRAALEQGWGLGLAYPLERDYPAFLAGPRIAAIATHLAAAARYALFGLLAYACVLLVRDRKQLTLSRELRVYLGTLVLAGLLLGLARIRIHTHYLIVFTPLLHIVAAWTLYRQRWAVLALSGLQLFLTASFLLFIHQHGGAPRADYGVAYRQQNASERRPLEAEVFEHAQAPEH
jgi:hypothetical protein